MRLMHHRRKALVAFVVLVSVFGDASGEQPATSSRPSAAAGRTECAATTAEIWVVPWEIQFQAGRLTPEEVQRTASIRIVFTSERRVAKLAKEFAERSAGVACGDSCGPPDLRLVARFSGKGCVRTFVADYGALYDLSRGTSGPIDQRFRDRFEVGP